MPRSRVLIVGHRELPNLAALFAEAVTGLGLTVHIEAVGAGRPRSRLARSVMQRTVGTRPLRVEAADRSLLAAVDLFRPDVVLATGFPDYSDEAIHRIRDAGVRTAVYLSDDPWNSVQLAMWSLPAVAAHDLVLTPRTANVEQLRQSGCANVQVVAFGYSPSEHISVVAAHRTPHVLFYGGADSQRATIVRSLLRARLEVQLYGGRWGRVPDLRRYSNGTASLATLREVVPRAAVCLVLVRRANRDGHTMRSFEAAAMGGSLLVERTADHEAIFGEDGQRVRYFNSDSQMVVRAAELLSLPKEAARLAIEAQRHITTSANTYRDRLTTILRLLS